MTALYKSLDFTLSKAVNFLSELDVNKESKKEKCTKDLALGLIFCMH